VEKRQKINESYASTAEVEISSDDTSTAAADSPVVRSAAGSTAVTSPSSLSSVGSVGDSATAAAVGVDAVALRLDALRSSRTTSAPATTATVSGIKVLSTEDIAAVEVVGRWILGGCRADIGDGSFALHTVRTQAIAEAPNAGHLETSEEGRVQSAAQDIFRGGALPGSPGFLLANVDLLPCRGNLNFQKVVPSNIPLYVICDFMTSVLLIRCPRFSEVPVTVGESCKP
jgi:hypothetical protein